LLEKADRLFNERRSKDRLLILRILKIRNSVHFRIKSSGFVNDVFAVVEPLVFAWARHFAEANAKIIFGV
jgi:hypothetical protein